MVKLLTSKVLPDGSVAETSAELPVAPADPFIAPLVARLATESVHGNPFGRVASALGAALGSSPRGEGPRHCTRMLEAGVLRCVVAALHPSSGRCTTQFSIRALVSLINNLAAMAPPEAIHLLEVEGLSAMLVAAAAPDRAGDAAARALDAVRRRVESASRARR